MVLIDEDYIIRKLYETRRIFSTRHLFLSILIQDFKLELSDEVRTAAIDFDEKVIKFNPCFAKCLIGEEIEKLPIKLPIKLGKIVKLKPTVSEDLLFVFAHEAFHQILLAKERAILRNIEPGTPEWKLWNMAQDYVINVMIEDLGIAKMPRDLYYDENAPECQKWNREGRGIKVNFCYDPKFRGWTTEEVYDYLLKQRGLPQNVRGIMGLPTPTAPGKEVDAPVDVVRGVPRSSEEARRFYREIEDKIIKGYNIARVPSGLERIIDEILRPKLDWRSLLQRYMKFAIMGSGREDYTWYPPHKKKYVVTGIYLPGMYERAVRAAVAVDTSGSITETEFKYFVSEVQGILNAFPSYELLIIVCDDHIETRNKGIVDGELIQYVATRDDYIFIRHRRGTVPPGFWRKGGGTDYKPVFKLIERLYFKPDVLVYFTDLICGPECFPPYKPPYPVIWVCTSSPREAYKPPWGDVIFYERERMKFTVF